MTIQKLVAGVAGGVGVSKGSGVASSVNGLIAQPANQSQSVILFGDSYAESQSFTPAPYLGNELSISLWRFALGGLGKSVNVVRNAGVSGNTVANMLTRYDADVKPFSADWVFFNAGVNDFYGFGYTAATVFGQVQELLTKMRGDGFKVLMVNCPPQVSTRSGFTSAKSTQCALYNNLLHNYVSTIDGVKLVDIYSVLLDWSDTTNASALAKYFGSDGIHLSVLGTIQCANAIKSRISDNFTPFLSQGLSPLDRGLAGLDAILFGTGGGHINASSGPVATGWVSNRFSGTNGTIVCSKVSPFGQRQTITLTASNGDSRFRLSNDLDIELASFLGKTVTTTIRGRCRTISGGVHLKELVLKLYLFNGTTITDAVSGVAYSGYSPLADDSFDTGEFTIKVKDVLIPNPLSDSGIFIELLLNSVAGGIVELDIYGVDIREVV